MVQRSKQIPQGAPLRGRRTIVIASGYLQGIDSPEIIDTVHPRPAPAISASTGLAGR